MTFGPEPIEWDDQTALLIEHLEEKASDRGLTRQEQALIDVVEAVELLEAHGDGLHDFWQSPLNHQRILKSFDLIGSSAMVDVLNASQWCQTRPAERDLYTETESDHLASIEEDLHEALSELPDLLADFVADEMEER